MSYQKECHQFFHLNILIRLKDATYEHMILAIYLSIFFVQSDIVDLAQLQIFLVARTVPHLYGNPAEGTPLIYIGFVSAQCVGPWVAWLGTLPENRPSQKEAGSSSNH